MFSQRKLSLPLDKTSGGGVLTPQLILWRRGFNPSLNPLEEGFNPSENCLNIQNQYLLKPVTLNLQFSIILSTFRPTINGLKPILQTIPF